MELNLSFFESHCIEVFDKAKKYAQMDKDSQVRMSHLLYTILKDNFNQVIFVLEAMNVDVDMLTEATASVRSTGIIKINKDSLTFHPEIENIVNNLNTYRQKQNEDVIFDVTDVVVEMIKYPGELKEVFESFYVSLEIFLETVKESENYYQSTLDLGFDQDDDEDIEIEIEIGAYEDLRFDPTNPYNTSSTAGNLNYTYAGHTPSATNTKNLNNFRSNMFGTNLTDLAKQNKLDPCIGRNEEIAHMISILSRKKKRNPVLIGKAGVGKTQIVEGLAIKIIKQEVPNNLKDKIIFQLNLNSLIAGTQYRGQFEDRLQNLLKDLENNPQVILFIDEIHTIIGAGSAEGTVDLSNILKPYLSKDAIQLIGATTIEEFKRIEKDKAMARRFNSILVEEPSISDTINIIKKIAPQYENFFGVSYCEDFFEACVLYADKFFPSKTFPDKAIDLLDELGAFITTNHSPKNEYEKEIVEKLIQLDKQKRQVIQNCTFELANDLNQQTKKYLKQLRNQQQSTLDEIKNVSKNDLEIFLQKRYSIQNFEDHNIISDLKNKLNQEIIGQTQAIEAIIDNLILNDFDQVSVNKPRASFLFLGASGIGKTETGKILANAYFKQKDNLLQINMSEYLDRSSVNKLIGSPPGFVGYDEGGILTDFVKTNPNCTIILDEIEKAHPDVLNILLEILDEGEIFDAKKNKISFKNTFIVLTSNVGAKAVLTPKIGFVKSNTQNDLIYESEMKKTFKPELLNRIDYKIIFNDLTYEDYLTILTKYIDEFKTQLNKKNIPSPAISDDQIKDIITDTINSKLGVRELKRQFLNKIKLPTIKNINTHV